MRIVSRYFIFVFCFVFMAKCVLATEKRQENVELTVKLKYVVDTGDGSVLFQGEMENLSTSSVQLSRYGLANALLRVAFTDPANPAVSTHVVPSKIIRDPPEGEAYFLPAIPSEGTMEFSERILGIFNLDDRDIDSLNYSVNWSVNMRDGFGNMKKALVRGTGVVAITP